MTFSNVNWLPFKMRPFLIISEFEMNLLIEKFKIDENILFYLPLFGAVKNLKLLFQKEKILSASVIFARTELANGSSTEKIWKDIKTTSKSQKLYLWCLRKEKVFQLHNEKKVSSSKVKSRKCRNCFLKLLKFYLHPFLLELELKVNCSKVCNLITKCYFRSWCRS